MIETSTTIIQNTDDNSPKLKINRIDKSLELPQYAKQHDAGIDLRSSEEVVLQPGEKQVVGTGIKLAVPSNHVGLIWDRSGLAAKNSITTMAGVIDAGYRGEVKIILINHGSESFKIEKGMRIAQLLVQPIIIPDIQEVDDLEDTQRGAGGLGSTGLY